MGGASASFDKFEQELGVATSVSWRIYNILHIFSFLKVTMLFIFLLVPHMYVLQFLDSCSPDVCVYELVVTCLIGVEGKKLSVATIRGTLHGLSLHARRCLGYVLDQCDQDRRHCWKFWTRSPPGGGAIFPPFHHESSIRINLAADVDEHPQMQRLCVRRCYT